MAEQAIEWCLNDQCPSSSPRTEILTTHLATPMLPLPSSTRPRRHGGQVSSAYAPLPLSGNVMGVLRSRSRLTNLAVALLLSVLTLSLLGNLRHTVASPQMAPHKRWQNAWDDLASAEVLNSGRPPSVETTIHRDTRFDNVDTLVLVPGHAVWLGSEADEVENDDSWVLEPMQKGGSVKTYVQHVKKGAELLRDPRTLLVFSGGATRSHLTSPVSEGVSYHRLAATLGLLPKTENGGLSPAARATVEEFALDSYENLLFSIARFREVTGRWPSHITVVGYGMKRTRFQQLHRGAIRFPHDRFTYIGIDDEGDTTEHYSGELKHGYAPFLFSPSGCRPPLSVKRSLRNPFARYPPYHSSTPELAGLLEWCPPETPVGDVAVPTTLRTATDAEPPAGFVVYEGELPWDGLARFEREKD